MYEFHSQQPMQLDEEASLLVILMEIIDDDLEVHSEIGEGSWSIVKQGFIRSLDVACAIKIEDSKKASLLLREAKIMEHLQGVEGVPRLYKYGTHEGMNYIAMEKLHCTLHQLRTQGLLKAGNLLQRAVTLLTTMQEMHKRGIIHQDLQPKNLMTSEDYLGSYYVDFGLATSICNQTSKGPRTVGILGTPSFSSHSALLGLEQDRKDDLESLGYNIVWLLLGKLPWESFAKERSLAGLKAAKLRTPMSMVCKGCPDELIHYFNYVKGLKFRDIPDYLFLKSLLECAANRVQNLRELPVSFSPQVNLRRFSEDTTLPARGNRYDSKLILGFTGASQPNSLEKKTTLTSRRSLRKSHSKAALVGQAREETASPLLGQGDEFGSYKSIGLKSLSKFSVLNPEARYESGFNPDSMEDEDMDYRHRQSTSLFKQHRHRRRSVQRTRRKDSKVSSIKEGSTLSEQSEALSRSKTKVLSFNSKDTPASSNGSPDLRRLGTLMKGTPNLSSKTRAQIALLKHSRTQPEKSPSCSVF
jgi:serine/threonine protein kinase